MDFERKLEKAFQCFCTINNRNPVKINKKLTLTEKHEKVAYVNKVLQNYYCMQVATPTVLGRPQAIQAFNGVGTPSRKKQRLLTKSVQNFNGSVKSMQNWTGSDAIEPFTDGAYNTHVTKREYDFSWQASFRTAKLIELKGGGQSLFWNIATGKNGIKFQKLPEGGKVNFAGFSGSKQVVNVERYGGGFIVTWETRNSQDFNAFTDAIMGYEAELFGTWADVHYGVLGAAADANPLGDLAYQGVATDPTLERDVRTINNAVVQLAEANKNKNYGDVASRNITMYYRLELQDRILAALKTVIASTNDREYQVAYNVIPYRTMNDGILASDGNKFEALFCLPGEKIQNAVHTRDLGLSETEVESGNEVEAHFTAFGAAVGDVDQVVRADFHD